MKFLHLALTFLLIIVSASSSSSYSNSPNSSSSCDSKSFMKGNPFVVVASTTPFKRFPVCERNKLKQPVITKANFWQAIQALSTRIIENSSVAGLKYEHFVLCMREKKRHISASESSDNESIKKYRRPKNKKHSRKHKSRRQNKKYSGESYTGTSSDETPSSNSTKEPVYLKRPNIVNMKKSVGKKVHARHSKKEFPSLSII